MEWLKLPDSVLVPSGGLMEWLKLPDRVLVPAGG